MSEEVLESGGPATDSPEETKNPPPSRGGGLPSVILAGALHLALLVTVAQAFSTGWPGRWWLVLGAVACFGFSAATFRKKPGWAVGAGALALGLTFLVPPLLFGVDGAGLSIVLVPLPTVASGLLILAFGFSGWVLWSLLSSLPIWARLIPGALALFAAVPVVIGLAEGVPFGEVLVGLWTLPYWVQGGWIGAAVLLPLATMAATVGVFKSRWRPARFSFRAQTGWVAFMLLMVLVTGLEMNREGLVNLATLAAREGVRPGENRSIESGTTRLGNTMPDWEADEPRPEQRETAGPVDREKVASRIEAYSRAVERLGESVPRRSFDVGSIVASVGADPEALLRWVADSTAWVPYRGSLRGPVGVLMDRRGNSLDRSLLLAEMLRSAGHEVRLARGELSEDEARQLLDHAGPARESRQRPLEAPIGWFEASEELLLEVGQNLGLGERAMRDSLNAVRARWEDLGRRAARTATDQGRRLIDAVGLPSRADEFQSVASDALAVRDHWWVQWSTPEGWTDLDPQLPTVGTNEAIVPSEEVLSVGQLADSLFHELTIRIVVEKWDKQGLKEDVALEHRLRPSESVGQVLTLSHVPIGFTDLPPGGADQRDSVVHAMRDQEEWLPVLRTGDQFFQRSSVLTNGDLNAKPGSGEAARSSASPSGTLGGLAGGLAGGGGGSTDAREGTEASFLSAEWIEYELHKPGVGGKKIRRELFDLVGPAERQEGVDTPGEKTRDQRVQRAAALLTEIEILPLVGALSEEFVSARAIEATSRNLEVVREVLERTTTAEAAQGQLSKLNRLPGATHSLALARSAWGEHTTYLDEINVLTHRTGLQRIDGSGAVALSAFDIVHNRVTVMDGDPQSAFRARLSQGILDTSAEFLILGGSNGLENTSAAYDMPGLQWKTVRGTDPDAIRRLGISPDAASRIAAELAEGYVAVVPQGFREEEGRGVPWWRIDPRNGSALGMGGNGLGQATAGYAERIVYGIAGGVPCMITSFLWVAWSGDNSRENATKNILVCAVTGVFGAVGAPAAYSTGSFVLAIISGAVGGVLDDFFREFTGADGSPK